MAAPADDSTYRTLLAMAQGFPPGIETFQRAEFIDRYWRYQAGEHVTFLGPTGSGKTLWAYQLLAVTATPKLPAVVLVMKPRDATVKIWSKATGMKTVRSWPPMPTMWGQRPPPGYVLWPKHTFDMDRDDEMLQREMYKAITDSYKRGNRILFADEVHGLTNELKLGRYLVTIWKRGRSMECGLWGASQRPAHIPLDAYSMAEHVFIAHDPDKQARDRYAEIGGVNPRLIQDLTLRLGKYQFCYVRRDGARVCVIDR